MDKERVMHILEWCDIDCGIDSNYGNWIVTENGDLVNISEKWRSLGYAIKSDEINSINRIAEFIKQGQLTEFYDIPNFKKAYIKACKITNTPSILTTWERELGKINKPEG